MPAFSMTPIQGFPQPVSQEFPNPLLFAHDGVQFTGPIQIVDFIGGTVTESEPGTLSVTLGGGGGSTPPANPNTALQYNNNGAFGATWNSFIGQNQLYWSAGDSGGTLTMQSLELTSAAQYSMYFRPRVSGSYRGTPELNFDAFAAWGASTVSTITYPPLEPNTITRAGFWAGGPETLGGSPGYDAWLVSNKLVFQDRASIESRKYLSIHALVWADTPGVMPGSYDNAFEVSFNGITYWVPCIAQ